MPGRLRYDSEEYLFPYLAEIPELRRLELQHGNAGFVNQSRGRVPRLNLLSEKHLYFAGILPSDQWEDGSVDCVEHLQRVRADVVKV